MTAPRPFAHLRPLSQDEKWERAVDDLDDVLVLELPVPVGYRRLRFQLVNPHREEER